jgi:hypothetical protein
MSGKCRINGRMSYTVTDRSKCDFPEDWVAHDDATPQGPGQTVTESAPAQSDDRPVALGYEYTTYQTGAGITGKPLMTTVYEGVRNFEKLAAKGLAAGAAQKDKDAFQNLLTDLRRVTGSELGTYLGQRDAYYRILQAAASGDVNAADILKGDLGSFDPDGSGSGSGLGGYSGPRASVVKQAESDINATANALALEMIGRPLNQKELNRITKRIRAAEVEQPTITSGSPARTVQQQGLTAQGREDILREVIAKRPEFEKFQLDTTVMDAMNAYVQEKRAVVDV